MSRILFWTYIAIVALAVTFCLYRGFRDPKQHWCKTVSECMEPEADPASSAGY